MSANQNPIFTITQTASWTTAITGANTAYDGTGANQYPCWLSGSNGSYVQRLRVKALGSCTATVLRVFINNGLAQSTAANNVLYSELSLPTTSSSNLTALPDFEIPMNLVLPAGYTISCSLGTAVSAGYNICAIGGQY